MLPTRALIFLPLFVALLASGCTIFSKKDRRTLNALDAHVSPQSVPARVALAPAMIPTGTFALATDALIVNPVVRIKPAWEDVYKLYWKPRDVDPLRKAIALPFCVALTPPSFVIDWVGRSLFDVD
jgi:hypothetical protein